VPANHGVRLYYQEHVFPARPEPPERDPEQAVERIQGRPRPFSFEDGDLLSEGDKFNGSVSARAKEDSDSRKESEEQIEHEPSFYHFAVALQPLASVSAN
jgi:hypothetical protein